MNKLDKILKPFIGLKNNLNRSVLVVVLFITSWLIFYLTSLTTLGISDLIALEQGLFVMISVFFVVFQFVSYGGIIKEEINITINTIKNRKETVMKEWNINNDVFDEFISKSENKIKSFTNIENKIGLAILYFIFAFFGLILIFIKIINFAIDIPFIEKQAVIDFLIIFQFIVITISSYYVFKMHMQRTKIRKFFIFSDGENNDGIIKALEEYSNQTKNKKIFD